MDDAENPNIVDFFLEPTAMTATLRYNHFRDLQVTGSKTQLEYELLQKQYALIDKNADSLYEKFSSVNQKYILDNSNSFVSAYELSTYRTRWKIDIVKSLYAKLTPAIQNSSYGKETRAIIDEVDANSKGKKASIFQTVDINSKPLNLSDFKDTYVLLDFWGSWCVPCRQSTPHLIDLFKQYHNKGLDIIGIAEEYDTSEVPWRDAIKKDGTGIWYHVQSRTNHKNNSGSNEARTIASLYGVHVYPTKILIDKNGFVVDRYTGTEEDLLLDKKLSELFKQ